MLCKTILLLSISSIVAAIDYNLENSINLRTNFARNSKECNIYDESVFCQQIVMDERVNLVAVSHKCQCPNGYRCPNDTDDTQSYTHCELDEIRHWQKCFMRCIPL